MSSSFIKLTTQTIHTKESSSNNKSKFEAELKREISGSSSKQAKPMTYKKDLQTVNSRLKTHLFPVICH